MAATVGAGLSMTRFGSVFKKLPAVIGMIHVQALPGTPCYKARSLGETIKLAKREARLYFEAGVDGIMIENMHDVPYLNRTCPPEITACMAVLAKSVQEEARGLPCGLQILAGCNKEALAVAKAAGLSFIRAESFVFSHVADEGLMNADAGDLMRYRKVIEAEHVLVFTDIKKKHSSHSITADLSVADVAMAADFFLSDGVIVTGSATGKPACPDHVRDALRSVEMPVLVGSGVDKSNFDRYMRAHAFIMGSYFKENGQWRNSVSPSRVREFMDLINQRRHLNNV